MNARGADRLVRWLILVSAAIAVGSIAKWATGGPLLIGPIACGTFATVTGLLFVRSRHNQRKSEREAAFWQRLQLLNRLQGEKNSLRVLEVDQKARPTAQRAEEIRIRQERVSSLMNVLGNRRKG